MARPDVLAALYLEQQLGDTLGPDTVKVLLIKEVPDLALRLQGPDGDDWVAAAMVELGGKLEIKKKISIITL